MFAVRSQDIERKYFDTGTFAALPSALVRTSEGAGSDSAFLGYVLAKDKAIDIDDEADWALAESMFHHRNAVGR
jgi:N-acylneuraminate cytidylyltransferase